MAKRSIQHGLAGPNGDQSVAPTKSEVDQALQTGQSKGTRKGGVNVPTRPNTDQLNSALLLSFLKTAPKWLSIGALGYVAVLISIAAIRGQNIKFFPPEIGPLPIGNSSESTRPLHDEITRLKEQNRVLESKTAELDLKYKDILGREGRPILERPADQASIIADQIIFNWNWREHTNNQRYILELRNILAGSLEPVRFVAVPTSPIGKYLSWPDNMLPYSQFIWRIIPSFVNNGVEEISDSPSEYRSFSIYPSVLSRILQSHRLVLATHADAAIKFVFYDNVGKLSGFDIDLSNWIGEKLSDRLSPQERIKVIPHNMEFGKLLPALKARDVDIIISTMTATKNREKQFGIKFSKPYFRPQQILIAKTQRNLSFSSIRGMKVGVEQDTTNESAANYLKDRWNFIVDNHYKTFDEVYNAIMREVIDFGIVDNIPYLDQSKGMAVKTIRELDDVLQTFYKDVLETDEYNFSVAVTDDTLLGLINEFISSAEGQQKLKALKEMWIITTSNKAP
jgi:arginine/lysine/histidine transporter system substrate-binding protein